ncbi:DUF2239 family protein [Bordetella sp. 2513F-2]
MQTNDAQLIPHCTAFNGHRRIAQGSPAEVAFVVRRVLATDPAAAVLVYDDLTGQLVELDLRGGDANPPAPAPTAAPAPSPGGAEAAAEAARVARGRGRPRLGVVAREVTLLPRHWEWLAGQPGGASVALRRLVEEASRQHAERDRLRQRQEAAYRYMSSMAGDFPGFEEATRALFAGDAPRLQEWIAQWPPDVREYTLKLLEG